MDGCCVTNGTFLSSIKSEQEILSARDRVSGGNIPVPAELVSTQPQSALAPPADPSEGSAGFQTPQGDLQRPCSRCGGCGCAPGHRPQPPVNPALSRLQGSSLSVHSSSSSSRSRRSKSSQQPAVTPGDTCLRLTLACLSCQCSVLLLGLLESCSSCLHALCSSCCHACARCCVALQEAPLEELNCHAHCHSVLFESCCEQTECLEFCLECCNICHHS
ncbi:myoD family inhibitor domain-containing protein-like [Genypterus blacodes]|uniref:myoD family inhibitor domain-containing protein-like n=1 Tax=Genypterus blacodes TaxID=154954 RepID=UPI003F758DDA